MYNIGMEKYQQKLKLLSICDLSVEIYIYSLSKQLKNFIMRNPAIYATYKLVSYI